MASPIHKASTRRGRTSPAKAQAARENGKRGGRPRTAIRHVLAEIVLDLKGFDRAFARASTALAKHVLA